MKGLQVATLVVGILLFAFVLTSLAQPTQHGHEKPHHARSYLWWTDKDIQKDLGLTSEQVTKIQSAWDKFDKNRNILWQEILKCQQQIEMAYLEEKLNPEKIIELNRKMMELQAKITDNRVTYRLEYSQILTYEQRKKLASTLKRYGIRGCPGCPKDLVGVLEEVPQE